MKKYQINSEGSKISISISVDDNNKDSLLNNFELCKQGKCGCPTDEYKKLESLDIMEKEGVILLGLTPKLNNNFNIKEIEKCLEFSMNKKDEENETTKEIKTIQIEIFDPPMCCPSGFCGPDIDPALLDINEAILRIKKEFDGQVKIERYLLSQQGPKFMQQPEVMKRLQTNGVEILPLTLVDGKVVKEKEYPGYEELIRFIKEKK